jgi:hypothetical protein
MGVYVFEDLKSQALWDEYALAELAYDVAWVWQPHRLIVLLFLAQLKANMTVWNFYHF